MPVIPALERPTQENENSGPAWAYAVRPYHKNKIKAYTVKRKKQQQVKEGFNLRSLFLLKECARVCLRGIVGFSDLQSYTHRLFGCDELIVLLF